MPEDRGDAACCDRCAGPGTAVRIARRRLLKAAVLRPAGHRTAGADAGSVAAAASATGAGTGFGPGPGFGLGGSEAVEPDGRAHLRAS